MKIDFYTQIHKALRRRLFLLAIELGKLDDSDIVQINHLNHELNDLFALLHLHAHHEATHFHPLIRRKLPHAVASLDAEHQEQETAMALIQNKMQLLISNNNPDKNKNIILEIYRLFNFFIAGYLAHLDEEEKIMPQLWACCTDAELMNALTGLLNSFSSTELSASLNYMLPALNTQEKQFLLGETK